ncbi:MAG: AI-2E family transporter [Limisphaerales bacterium]
MSFPDPSEKQAKIIWSGMTIVSIALSLAVIGGVIYGVAGLISHLSPILMPIAIAGIIACLLDPAVVFFEKFKIPRFRAILLVYIIAAGMLLGMLGTVLPAVYVQAAGLIGDVPGWINDIQKIVTDEANAKKLKVEKLSFEEWVVENEPDTTQESWPPKVWPTEWPTPFPGDNYPPEPWPNNWPTNGTTVSWWPSNWPGPPPGNSWPPVPSPTNWVANPWTNDLPAWWPSGWPRPYPPGTNWIPHPPEPPSIRARSDDSSRRMEVMPKESSKWFADAAGHVREIWNDPRFKKHIKGIESTAKSMLSNVGDWLFHQFSAVAHLLGWAIGIVLIPVYIFYFLMSKQGILANWKDLLPIHHESDFRKEFVFIVNSVTDAMLVFFRGQILVGMISGILLAVGLWMQGVKYSLLIGFIAALLGVVPYLGFLLSMLLACVVSAVQFGDGTQPMITLAICIVVHWAEGFGYQPRIIGDRVGLHPMMIIVALFLGATLLGGLLGGLLGIPLAALIRTLMKRYVWVKYRHEVDAFTDDDDGNGESKKVAT